MRRALAPALLVLVVYGAWVAFSIGARGHDATDFAFVGKRFVERSHASAAIDRDRAHATSRTGYDGQFFLYAAQDPRRAPAYIDRPNYRLSRIGYPAVARALALGRQGAIPALLVAVNVLALAGGTLAVALWLVRHGTTPWASLAFGLYPGLFVSLTRDLSEPLAYALAAWAVVAFERRLALSAALFAAAMLTRESTLVFIAPLAVALWLRDRRRAMLFATGTVAPYAAWKVVLAAWVGVRSSSADATFVPPFTGLAHAGIFALVQLVVVVVPATIALVLAVRALRRNVREPLPWAIVVSWIAFVALLPKEVYVEYIASGRVAAAVPVALVLALPVLRAHRLALAWAWTLWALPWLWVAPGALSRSWV